MVSKSERVTGDEHALPVMFVQAVMVASVLCIGELVCAPIFVGMSHNVLAVIPWAFAACLFAVAFTYTVGFAVLWAGELLTDKITPRVRPFAFAVFGMLGFGVWSAYVLTSFLNSILTPLGLDQLTSGEQLAIGVNGAALGFAAFFLASALGTRLASKRVAVISACVATVLAAALGAFFVYAMYTRLY